MTSGKRWLCRALIACISAGALVVAQDKGTVSTDGNQTQDITALKAMIAAQQKQLDALKQALDNQQKVLDQALSATATAAQKTAPASVGQVASIAPVFPAAVPATLAAIPAIPVPQAAPAPAAGGNPCEAPADQKVPTYLRIGNTCVIPIGFMDMTGVWRSKDVGSSIGTTFANIPYNNVAAGRLSEYHMSPQNSRLGFRVDGDWKGTHFIGYNEFDFNGTSGGNNLTTTNGSFVPRIRLFWVDVRKGGVEFLAGQSWSLLTPNRKGLSALPGDLFYGQEIDLNYLTGLTWTRQPGMRVIFHPSDKIAFGLSVENPDAYIGGSSGGPSVTLPAALAAITPTSVSSASNNNGNQTTADFAPDFIAKLAFDPTSRIHFEVAGLQSTFKDWNPNTNVYKTAIGAGVSANAILGITDDFRLTSSNFWSDGGGRYLFGQAPDLIIRADGSISPIHSGGFTEGFETNVMKNTLLYGYWGGTYVGRDVALDLNGSLIGYGYKGSSNAQNRMIQEVTFGFNQTVWKSAAYGAINIMGQYMYEVRAPWYYAGGAGGKGTQASTIYFNVRYTLPGSMPKF
jgi:uncharacterized coiled-coil protein SlyX